MKNAFMSSGSDDDTYVASPITWHSMYVNTKFEKVNKHSAAMKSSQAYWT